MFGIGGTELLVILVVALIVLGPKSVPQIARTLGRAMGEFRKVYKARWLWRRASLPMPAW